MGKGELTIALNFYSLSTFLPSFSPAYLGQCYTNATRLIAAWRTASALLHRAVLPCKAQTLLEMLLVQEKARQADMNLGILPSSSCHQGEGQAGTTPACAAPGTSDL